MTKSQKMLYVNIIAFFIIYYFFYLLLKSQEMAPDSLRRTESSPLAHKPCAVWAIWSYYGFSNWFHPTVLVCETWINIPSPQIGYTLWTKETVPCMSNLGSLLALLIEAWMERFFPWVSQRQLHHGNLSFLEIPDTSCHTCRLLCSYSLRAIYYFYNLGNRDALWVL